MWLLCVYGNNCGFRILTVYVLMGESLCCISVGFARTGWADFATYTLSFLKLFCKAEILQWFIKKSEIS